MPWELCSREDVVNIHPIPINDLRDEWSAMVEALIRQYLGQPHLGRQRSITQEYYNGDGTHLLRLSKPPVLSVEEVFINGILISENDYVLFNTHIELKSQVFPKGVLNVRVSYTSGSDEIDEVVRLAAIAMIVAIVNYRKRYGADSSFKWSSADQKAGESEPNMNVGLTSHLVRIMKQLLRRASVRVR
jgi:hypothetical protein